MERNQVIEISKVLSNPVRLNILKWLKNPEENFPPHEELGHFDYGVCVLYIQEKANLSQSTISHYLTLMQKAELITPTRIGKWTYYKRDESTIKKFAEVIVNEY